MRKTARLYICRTLTTPQLRHTTDDTTLSSQCQHHMWFVIATFAMIH